MYLCLLAHTYIYIYTDCVYIHTYVLCIYIYICTHVISLFLLFPSPPWGFFNTRLGPFFAFSLRRLGGLERLGQLQRQLRLRLEAMLALARFRRFGESVGLWFSLRASPHGVGGVGVETSWGGGVKPIKCICVSKSAGLAPAFLLGSESPHGDTGRIP